MAPTAGTPEALCSQLQQCVAGHPGPDGLGPDVDRIDHCDPPRGITGLPPHWGIDTLSFVRMEGETMNRHGVGVYLVAQRGESYCVVDELLPFSFSTGWFEDDIALTPVPGVARVRVAAHRVLRNSLDAEEAALGVSDIESETCDRHTYEVSEGVLSRLERSTQEGACATAGPAPRSP